jgi:predicted CoA-binding protein
MTAEERRRARDMLDLEEGRGPVAVLDGTGIAALLRTARRIAVVGASEDPGRPSHGVFRYLVDQGYDCVPINPNATEVLRVPAFPSLVAAVDATGPFDIVDVFRRSELCVPHAREAVATGARCLWLQLGVVNWEAARIASEGGLSVVMDRCTAIEHRRLPAG